MERDTAAPSPGRITADVLHLKEWMSKEPHLPKIEDDEWLKLFLRNNKYSLEKTKRKLENYYTLRSLHPGFFKARNPTSPEVLRAKRAVTVAFSNKLTKNGGIMIFYKFNPDASLLNTQDFTKRVFMLSDLQLLEHPSLNSVTSVVDCDGISYQHILKVAMGVGILADIYDKAYTDRLIGIHLINAPSTVHLMTDLLKKHFSAKIGGRIYTHTPTKSTLLELVDVETLCSDFGGKGPSLAKLDDYTQQSLEKHRKWFDEQEDVCSNELLRRQNDNQVEILKGSFRKLEVD